VLKDGDGGEPWGQYQATMDNYAGSWAIMEDHENHPVVDLPKS
jgi:hypothetical protein